MFLLLFSIRCISNLFFTYILNHSLKLSTALLLLSFYHHSPWFQDDSSHLP